MTTSCLPTMSWTPTSRRAAETNSLPCCALHDETGARNRCMLACCGHSHVCTSTYVVELSTHFWQYQRVAHLLLNQQELKGIDVRPAPGTQCPASGRGSLPRVPAASLRPLLVQAQQRFVSVRPHPAIETHHRTDHASCGNHEAFTGHQT